jgi:hypothetical protein
MAKPGAKLVSNVYYWVTAGFDAANARSLEWQDMTDLLDAVSA